jgi:hypothetical protein
MEELSIVLGLVVIIVIYIMYNKHARNRPCDDYVSYFDKMYYELPELNTVNEMSVQDQGTLNDLNTIKQQLRKVRNVGDGSNPMSSRWASHADLHSRSENGSPIYTNADLQVIPTDLQHQLKKGSNKVIKNNGQRNAKSESFADDECLDQNFSFNQKFMYGMNENL